MGVPGRGVTVAENYGLRYLDGDSSGEGAKTAGGYSIDSDYGTYALIITMKGREISSWVENANNWWRTDIRFDLTSQPGGGFRVKRTLHIINDEKMSVETEEWSAEWRVCAPCLRSVGCRLLSAVLQ